MVKNSLITIFGGSGFVGRYTVRALAKAGYRLRVATRRPALANYLLPMGSVGQIQLQKLDTRDAAAVESAIQGAEIVINLTGALYPRGQSFEQVHVDSAAHVARAAQNNGVRRLIHISALGAHPESDCAYARTKAEGEAALRAAYPQATILRPSAIFGPEDTFFNQFAAMARYLPVLPLPGADTQVQPVFVGDVAAAIAKVIDTPQSAGQIYELGGPRSYTFRALMEVMLEVIARKRLLLPLPYSIALAQATVLQFIPGSPLTRDVVKFSQIDNVVSPGAKTLQDLSITPDSVEAVIPTYLWRFRRDGQFAKMPEKLSAAATHPE